MDRPGVCDAPGVGPGQRELHLLYEVGRLKDDAEHHPQHERAHPAPMTLPLRSSNAVDDRPRQPPYLRPSLCPAARQAPLTAAMARATQSRVQAPKKATRTAPQKAGSPFTKKPN